MEEKLNELTLSKAVLIGIVAMGFYWGIFYDGGSKQEIQIRKVTSELAKAKDEVKKSEKAIADAKRFEVVANQLGELMEKVVQAIPEKLSEIDLMKLISTEAKIVGANILKVEKASGRSFRSNNRKDSDKPDFFEEVSVSVELICTFKQMMMYLSNLTRVDKIITLKTLKLETAKSVKRLGEDGSPLLTMKAVISAYRYKRPDA